MPSTLQMSKKKRQRTEENTHVTMQKHFIELEKRMVLVSNSGKAVAMKKYMKNRFDMLGIQKPEREAVHTSFRREVFTPSTEGELIDWVHLLWEKPLRDYQYIAMAECQKSRKLLQSAAGIAEVENCLLHHQWWDTIDTLASNIIGGYYAKQPFDMLEKRTHEWIGSSDMWLNRTAMLVQLKYKTQTNTQLLSDSLVPHLNSTEFFHQKAIGWALREYAKTDEAWVRQFVATNDLKPLSRREALKHLQ